MTKKILSATLVATFTFSGCSPSSDPKPTKDKVEKDIKKVDKATIKAKKVANSVKDVTTKAKETTKTTLPQSTMKDKVIQGAVEIADEKTDGTASKIIESVK
jgi:hypothetical protein